MGRVLMRHHTLLPPPIPSLARSPHRGARLLGAPPGRLRLRILACISGFVTAASAVQGVWQRICRLTGRLQSPSDNSGGHKHGEQETPGTTIVRILCRDSPAHSGAAETLRSSWPPGEDSGLVTPLSSECRTFTQAEVPALGASGQGAGG